MIAPSAHFGGAFVRRGRHLSREKRIITSHIVVDVDKEAECVVDDGRATSPSPRRPHPTKDRGGRKRPRNPIVVGGSEDDGDAEASSEPPRKKAAAKAEAATDPERVPDYDDVTTVAVSHGCRYRDDDDDDFDSIDSAAALCGSPLPLRCEGGGRGHSPPGGKLQLRTSHGSPRTLPIRSIKVKKSIKVENDDEEFPRPWPIRHLHHYRRRQHPPLAPPSPVAVVSVVTESSIEAASSEQRHEAVVPPSSRIVGAGVASTSTTDASSTSDSGDDIADQSLSAPAVPAVLASRCPRHHDSPPHGLRLAKGPQECMPLPLLPTQHPLDQGACPRHTRQRELFGCHLVPPQELSQKPLQEAEANLPSPTVPSRPDDIGNFQAHWLGHADRHIAPPDAVAKPSAESTSYVCLAVNSSRNATATVSIFSSSTRSAMGEALQQPSPLRLRGPNRDTDLLLAIRDGDVDGALELVHHCSGGRASSSSSSSRASHVVAATASSASSWLPPSSFPPEATQLDHPNARGVTPLMLASQRGYVGIVRALLDTGQCNLLAASHTGTTALMQACSSGHADVVRLLLSHPNGGSGRPSAQLERSDANSGATALTKAAKRGHASTVRMLLQHGADPNAADAQKTTALVFASRQGHIEVVRELLRAGANADARCATGDLTALMIACQRDQVEAARVLSGSGCDLHLRDKRGRTAADTALQRGWSLGDVRGALCPEGQVWLMRAECRARRNYELVRMWTLLWQERATVVEQETGDGNYVGGERRRGSCYTICAVASHTAGPGEGLHPALRRLCPSDAALVQAMTLPAPLLGLIALYLPAPELWERRIASLAKRCHVEPDSAIAEAMDLIDEVLERGGFPEACDVAGLDPPIPTFKSWVQCKAWGRMCDRLLLDTSVAAGSDADQAATMFWAASPTSPPPAAADVDPAVDVAVSRGHRPSVLSSLEIRHSATYLTLLAHGPPLLARTLLLPPYCMPGDLLRRLQTVSDIQSLVRRMGSRGVHFEAGVAMEVVMVARQAVLWHRSCCEG